MLVGEAPACTSHLDRQNPENVSAGKQEKEKEMVKYNVWLKGEKTLWYNLKNNLICVFKLIILIYKVVQIKAYFSFFSFALPFTPSLIS